MRQKALTRAAVVFLLWNVLGFLVAAHYHIRGGGGGALIDRLASIIPFYWVWAFLTPLVLYVARRFDPLERPWPGAVAAHVAAAACVTLLQLGLYILLMRVLLGGELAPCLTQLSCLLRGHASGDIATYGVVVGGYLGFRQYGRAEKRKRGELRLAAQLADARLAALAMQLHPHFFFNALNTVSVLVLKGEGQAAIRAIARIGELVRAILATESEQEVPLGEEVAFAERYLEIEHLRFGDRLRVETDLDAGTEDVPVPRLILQPLVENAVRHGLGSRSDEGGCVRLTATRDGDTLRLQVADNGAGPVPASGEPTEGVGLGNARKRLHELYGPLGHITLTREEEWTVASIELPVRTDMGPHATRARIRRTLR